MGTRSAIKCLTRIASKWLRSVVAPFPRRFAPTFLRSVAGRFPPRSALKCQSKNAAKCQLKSALRWWFLNAGMSPGNTAPRKRSAFRNKYALGEPGGFLLSKPKLRLFKLRPLLFSPRLRPTTRHGDIGYLLTVND